MPRGSSRSPHRMAKHACGRLTQWLRTPGVGAWRGRLVCENNQSVLTLSYGSAASAARLLAARAATAAPRPSMSICGGCGPFAFTFLTPRAALEAGFARVLPAGAPLCSVTAPVWSVATASAAFFRQVSTSGRKSDSALSTRPCSRSLLHAKYTDKSWVARSICCSALVAASSVALHGHIN